MVLRVLGVASFLFVIGCSGDPKTDIQSLKIDEQTIDEYVAEKLDTSQNYQILTGMRFSKGDNYAYSAVRFSQNDTAILYTEQEEQLTGVTYRNLFFKDGLPVYVEEDISYSDGMKTEFIQRKVYFNGAIILKALERKAGTLEELEVAEFKEITMTMNQFDFEKAEKSVTQTDEFEMVFGEILVIDLTSYLIVENKESGYTGALLILKPDDLIEQLYTYEDEYKGQKIRAYHEFMFIGGMEQMIYMGGEIVK